MDEEPRTEWLIQRILYGFLALCGLLVAVPVFGFIGLFSYLAWSDYRFAKSSPIVANLPTEIAKIGEEFERRVKTRFPIGSSVNEIRRELGAQAFVSPPGVNVQRAPSNTVILTRGALGCSGTWTVSWTSSEDGNIASLSAGFRSVCI